MIVFVNDVGRNTSEISEQKLEGKRRMKKCGDNHAMFIRCSLKTILRTAISGGKRPNPSDLGS